MGEPRLTFAAGVDEEDGVELGREEREELLGVAGSARVVVAV